jgi:hypothetical protein
MGSRIHRLVAGSVDTCVLPFRVCVGFCMFFCCAKYESWKSCNVVESAISEDIRRDGKDYELISPEDVSTW